MSGTWLPYLETLAPDTPSPLILPSRGLTVLLDPLHVRTKRAGRLALSGELSDRHLSPYQPLPSASQPKTLKGQPEKRRLRALSI